jgi:hypothetical protein
MRSELIQHTIDDRHADRLNGALALLDHFGGDRLNRMSRTHGVNVAPNRLQC